MFKIPYPVNFDYVKKKPVFLTFCPPDFLDQNGCSILQGRSIFNKPTEDSYQVCPYKDSRHGHKNRMNNEALGLFSRNIKRIESYISSVCSQVASEQPSEALITQITRFSYATVKVPNYRLMASIAHNQFSVDISPCEAAIARVSDGVLNLLRTLARDSRAGLSESWTADDYYAYADRRGLLVGRSEVCAASPSLIKHYFSLVLENLKGNCRATLDTEIARNIGMFAIQCACIEAVALIYEVTRCHAWLLRNSVEIYSDCLRDKDHDQPKVRGTVTDSVIVIKLAKELRLSSGFNQDAAFWKVFIKGGKEIGLVLELLSAADDYVRSARLGIVRALDEWAFLESLTLKTLNTLNMEMVGLFGWQTRFDQILPMDLEIFFGASVYRSR